MGSDAGGSWGEQGGRVSGASPARASEGGVCACSTHWGAGWKVGVAQCLTHAVANVQTESQGLVPRDQKLKDELWVYRELEQRVAQGLVPRAKERESSAKGQEGHVVRGCWCVPKVDIVWLASWRKVDRQCKTSRVCVCATHPPTHPSIHIHKHTHGPMHTQAHVGVDVFGNCI